MVKARVNFRIFLINWALTRIQTIPMTRLLVCSRVLLSSASVHDSISVLLMFCLRVVMLYNLESRPSDAADDIDNSDEDFDIEEDVDELVGTSLAELPRFDELLFLFHKVPLQYQLCFHRDCGGE
jgi:hypothetical protein